MTDGVHATMAAMQPATTHAMLDRSPPQTGRDELLGRYRSALPLGEHGNGGITGCGEKSLTVERFLATPRPQ